MLKSVFISYSHQQGEWVFDRLVPILKSAGVTCYVDRERFKAGRALARSMDEWQDQADVTLVVLSPDHLASSYCEHEMKRAMKRDPKFTKGLVVPVIRVACPLPAGFKRPNPIVVDLASDDRPEPWSKLIEACGGVATSCPVEWLEARDRVRSCLRRNESVNLVVRGPASWRQLIDHLREESPLGLVNLEDPDTCTRRGLVQAILDATGANLAAPDEPHDLAALGRVLEGRETTRVALTHFDLISRREYVNRVDLFSALRYWLMDLRKLVLLVQTRTPFSALVPSDHPLSPIALKTVELRGRE